MSKPIPTIQKWMSTTPTTIDPEATLERAHAVMRSQHIRHLPVVERGHLSGLVSQSDLRLIETLGGVDVQGVSVVEAMTANPYTVSPSARLDEVAAEMAERKIGSAVVLQNGKVVGIFTAIDALRALTELLHGRLAS
jgi:acetoin utilization protein AcuB